MKIIKKLLITLSILFSMSSLAFADQAAVNSAQETIGHVEQALVEIDQSDFSTANLHLKAARASSTKITGNEAIIKQANDSIVQGQIESKKGDVASSTALLKKGIELYKSL